jgi:hypothetical protein
VSEQPLHLGMDRWGTADETTALQRWTWPTWRTRPWRRRSGPHGQLFLRLSDRNRGSPSSRPRRALTSTRPRLARPCQRSMITRLRSRSWLRR